MDERTDEAEREPVGRILVRAVQRHQRGDPAEALVLYRRVLASEPGHPDALNLGGVAAFQSGDRALGLALLRRAVAAAPESPEARNNLGNLLQEEGALEEAQAAFETAVTLKPGFAQGHKNLGNVLQLAGKPEPAACAYRRALALTPGDPELHDALGAALTALGDFGPALESYRRAVELDPAYAKAFNNMAAALQKLDRLEEALEACRRATSLSPDYAKAHFNLGCVSQALRRGDLAVGAFRRTLELAPDHAEAAYNLGQVLQASGEPDQARSAYRAALAADPDHASARHMLDALSGRTTEIAPEAHVRQMFDNYARGFETHLVDVLGYSAPEALERAVADFQESRGAGQGFRFDRMLDLGCGTGLVARRFRDRTDRIDGVDLAPEMVALARESGLYDEVHEATLAAYFDGHGDSSPAYDLVTSADVFIYIGRLDQVFQSVSRIMLPGGLFVFSLERLEAGDYALVPSGRYAQSESYVRDLADRTGFRTELCSPFLIRKEYDAEIDGLACLLVRDG